jgi:spermidine synthase
LKIPRWKKLLSHVVPLTLEETGSEQNPELTVTLDRGRLQLLSGDAIYSWDDLYKNFLVAFEQLQLEERSIGDVLVLGLGLGSVPYMLEKVYHRKYCYTAVEWDETVAELAAKYTLSRLSSPISVVIADAEVFVQVTEEQYDMIVVDIFEDDLTPPQFETEDFLLDCDDLLRPGGLLLFNRLHGGSAAIRTITERFFERDFKAVFPEARAIDTEGNWILYYQKGEAE